VEPGKILVALVEGALGGYGGKFDGEGARILVG